MQSIAQYAAALLLVSVTAEGAPVDLSTPPNSLGSSNAHGNLQLWREIDEVDFGDGLKLPLRIQFSSGQPNGISPYLGNGFWCPLVSANCYLKRERMMRATLVCGKAMYLEREKNDPNKFHTLDKEWTGTLDGDHFTISRADGWELHYKRSRIQKLKTDTGRVLTWIYAGNLVSEIREEGATNSPFKVSATSNGTPNGFSVNGQLHSFELSNRPRVQNINGANVIGGMDQSLSLWKYPDKKQDSFQFEVTPQLQPNLTLVDKSNVSNTYVWDPKTNYILSENGWVYQTQSTNKSDLPKLKRTNVNGQEEFLYIDKKKGITEQKALNGIHRITRVFTSEGPLYGKVRTVEQVANGSKRLLYHASYDEFGRLVRKTDASGFTTSYLLDKNGKVSGKKVIPPQDRAVLKPLMEQEANLAKAIAAAESPSEREKKVAELGYFYIHQLRQPTKVLTLLAQVTDPGTRYNLQLHAIDHDCSLTPQQKITGYKKLLAEYPRHQDTLESLIKMREIENEQE